jgi:hypothetical protein
MDDPGTSRGRHAADSDGPNDAEPRTEAVTPPHGQPVSEATAGPSDPDPGESPGTGETDEEPARRGRMRQQDPSTTTPRQPTVAEQRARREAQRRERAQAEAAEAAEERKRKTRKRVLVGGGVAVGLVAVIAIVYAASGSDDEVTATCTDQNGVAVEDRYCAGTPVSGSYGGGFVPIFLGGFGNQYHYNYGSPTPVGGRVLGGSTTAPSSGTSIRSGTSGARIGSTDSSGTVSRGGLGVGSSSSSSGSGSSSSGS